MVAKERDGLPLVRRLVTLSQMSKSDSKMLSRRKFLSFGIAAIATLISAATAIPFVAYAVSPALRKDQVRWLEVGLISDITLGVPKKLEYASLKRDGWVEETTKKAVWVLTKDGQNYTVYDPRCTHLGCAYSWQADKNRFFCPCHDGVFDLDGRVIGGPPPRPLDRFETKIENGKLYVGRLYSVDSNLQPIT